MDETAEEDCHMSDADDLIAKKNIYEGQFRYNSFQRQRFGKGQVGHLSEAMSSSRYVDSRLVKNTEESSWVTGW